MEAAKAIAKRLLWHGYSAEICCSKYSKICHQSRKILGARSVLQSTRAVSLSVSLCYIMMNACIDSMDIKKKAKHFLSLYVLV
jgi:hypothetical protein